MKIFAFLSMLAVCWLPSFASSAGWQSLVVDVRDADPIILDLSETLSLRVDDGVLVISDFDDSYEVSLFDIVSVTHRKTPHNVATGDGLVTAVDSVVAGSDAYDAPSIELTREGLLFHGFPSHSAAYVHTLSGDTVLSFPLEDDYVLSLSSLESGVYLVKAGNVSLKIRK